MAPKLTPVAFPVKSVRRVFNQFAGDMGATLLDGRYWCLTRPEWTDVIGAIGPDHNRYVADRYDCDDYAKWWAAEVAHRFEINAAFIVVDYGARHSYNCLLEHDGHGNIHPRLLEPQSLTFPAIGKKPYLCRSGFFFG